MKIALNILYYVTEIIARFYQWNQRQNWIKVCIARTELECCRL